VSILINRYLQFDAPLRWTVVLLKNFFIAGMIKLVEATAA
jgi:hypothetical protein